MTFHEDQVKKAQERMEHDSSDPACGRDYVGKCVRCMKLETILTEYGQALRQVLPAGKFTDWEDVSEELNELGIPPKETDA